MRPRGAAPGRCGKPAEAAKAFIRTSALWPRKLPSLPVHMAICSVIHAKVVQIRIAEGVAVWLVEKLIKLTLLTALAGMVALLLLIGKG